MPTSGRPAPRARVVALGASAGGVTALTALVRHLHPQAAAAFFVVLHMSPTGTSVLPEILTRAGLVPAAVPRDREPVVTGQMYVAPPDRHLFVEESLVRVTRGPWDNGRRPSIDVLFRSVADWYGPAAVGVVLSGALDDGASGLAAIARNGGTALVQDPLEAEVKDMPAAAINAVPDAEVLSTADLAHRINELVGSGTPAVAAAAEQTAVAHAAHTDATADLAIAGGERIPPERLDLRPVGLTCPDCDGSLFAVPDPDVDRFRCRVGHAWTAAALAESHARGIERALYTALRVLEDRQSLQDRLVTRASQRGRHLVAESLIALKNEQAMLIETLRAAISEFGSTAGADPSGNGDDRSSEAGVSS